ncbi:hypothetical protein QY76_04790 [Edwardsiella sp. EA181011]|nr:hypothetical protein QY76_04790 [Edwardsiella sp. EA181011]
MVVDSVPGQIWFSESEWLEWCNDIVHFSDIEAIPISLKDILATWVLGDFFFGHKIIIKQITTLVLLDGFYPQATINSEDKNIAMVMLSTPLSFLSFFGNGDSEIYPYGQFKLFDFEFYLAIGYDEIVISQLELGGAIRVNNISNIDDDQVWISYGSPLGIVRVENSKLNIIETLYSPAAIVLDDAHDYEHMYYYCVGKVTLNISELDRFLVSGAVNYNKIMYFPNVKIINGKSCIAEGELVKINDAFYVELLNLE